MPKIIQVRNFYDISTEEWRVITAIETGMRNHEYVNLNLIQQFAEINFNGGSFVKILRNTLIPRRVIAFQNNGYRLTNLGYDFLALHNFIKCQTVSDLSIFRLIGTGKESDIYICRAGNSSAEKSGMEYQAPIVLKFHRLGRTSFKQVLNKREYKKGSKCSWLYMNRISASREYITMKALYEVGIPVPVPLAHNRGAVVMEYVKSSYPLFKFSKAVLKNGAAEVLFKQASKILTDFAQLGLVHGDLNEFNLLVETNDNGDDIHVGNYQDDLPNQESNANEDNEELSENYDDESSDEDSEDDDEEEDADDDEEDDEEEEEEDIEDEENKEDDSNVCFPYMHDDVNTFKLRVIDFPQVISRNNKTAQEIYTRDRHGLIGFFEKFMKIREEDLPPAMISDIERHKYLDVDLKAPGYPRKQDLKDVDIEYTKDKVGGEDGAKGTKRTFSVDEIKSRLLREQRKTQGGRISKQQRNTKKGQFRNDIKFEF